MKSYTDLEQSMRLKGILPIESADMTLVSLRELDNVTPKHCATLIPYKLYSGIGVPCWSLTALLDIFPEINDTPLILEKVKARDGYEGYYYHISYKDVILIPYSKNPVDACVEMIIALYEQKFL